MMSHTNSAGEDCRDFYSANLAIHSEYEPCLLALPFLMTTYGRHLCPCAVLGALLLCDYTASSNATRSTLVALVVGLSYGRE
jgi:hypothetical protein